MSEFKKQVISSSKWAMLNQLVTQVIRLGVAVYMMRLLEPESFGVFMKVLAVVGISEILVGLRLGGGIVQTQKLTKTQISTAFWTSILSALILSIIFFLVADNISSFYSDERITLIVKIASVVILFMGLGIVPRSMLIKNLQYRSIFIVNMVAITVSSIIGLLLAHNNYEYWSLVWQWSSFNILLSVGYLLIVGVKISFTFNWTSVKPLWNFSNKLILDDSLNYGARNLDNVLIGKYLNSVDLGYYSRAYGLMMIPLQNFVNIIRGLLFPAFSMIKEDLERVKRVFLQSTQTVSFLLLPFFLFGLNFTNEIVLIILGEIWLPIVPILRILLLLAIIQSHTTLISSIILSFGKSDLILKVSYISKPILFAAMFFSVKFGLIVLAATIVTVSGITSIYLLFMGFKLINLNPKNYVLNVLPIFAMAVLIAFLTFIFHRSYQNLEYNITLLLVVLLSNILLYSIPFYFFNFTFFKVLRKEFSVRFWDN